MRLDNDMKPYLLELKKHFTAYSLYYTLAMKSKYSIRIYELLKSYEFVSEYIFKIESLKKMLDAEKYKLYADFRVKVIDVAVREINEFSDITVTYAIEKQGRKFEKIVFKINQKKDIDERLETLKKIERRLNIKG
jgi:plasmid replication initiation protein